MNKKLKYYWVVQMAGRKAWHNTTGNAINRREGREELRKWEKRNPDDRFRLNKVLAWPRGKS